MTNDSVFHASVQWNHEGRIVLTLDTAAAVGIVDFIKRAKKPPADMVALADMLRHLLLVDYPSLEAARGKAEADAQAEEQFYTTFEEEEIERGKSGGGGIRGVRADSDHEGVDPKAEGGS